MFEKKTIAGNMYMNLWNKLIPVHLTNILNSKSINEYIKNRFGG